MNHIISQMTRILVDLCSINQPGQRLSDRQNDSPGCAYATLSHVATHKSTFWSDHFFGVKYVNNVVGFLMGKNLESGSEIRHRPHYGATIRLT